MWKPNLSAANPFSFADRILSPPIMLIRRICRLASSSSPMIRRKSTFSGGKQCLTHDSLSTVATIISPSVVHLEIPLGFISPSPTIIGSGILVDTVGTILTCTHVIADTEKRSRQFKKSLKRTVNVTLSDGRIYNGRIIFTDYRNDIGLVKIDCVDAEFSPAIFGDSSKVSVGDFAMTFGSTLGLPHCFSFGIISSIKRTRKEVGAAGDCPLFLQTDCASNIGNSGGPLVNLNGQVIAVTIGGCEHATGIQISCPVNFICELLESKGYKLVKADH